jgi:asparagine synthase (glutamine-hydrolysing)
VVCEQRGQERGQGDGTGAGRCFGRVKSPYPSTQDPEYVAEIERQANALPPNSPVFSLIDRSVVESGHRFSLERVLNLGAWLDIYQPEMVF